MPRKPQPVAVLKANGSRHYSKAQLEQREAGEIKPPVVKSLEPPSYLSGSLAKEFRELAPILIKMGVLTAVDADGLARYLVAKNNYIRASNRLTAAINSGNTREAGTWSAIQDRFFRQCRSAGGDLGLTVTGRCALSIPAEFADERGDAEEDDLFGNDI